MLIKLWKFLGDCGRKWEKVCTFATLNSRQRNERSKKLTVAEQKSVRSKNLRQMNGFFGRHSAKVDDKGRLVIPSAIKGVVSEDQMKFVIRKDMHSDCLEMFTYSEWEPCPFREQES